MGIGLAAVALAVIVVLLIDLVLYMCGVNYEAALFPRRFQHVTTGDVAGKSIPHRVVICTLCRNNSEHASEKGGMTRLEKIGECFEDYRVLVFENDSRDDTRQVLRAWSEANPRVILLGDEDEHGRVTLDVPTGYELELEGKQRTRMRHMAQFRNEYLRAMQQRIGPEFTKVLVIDFDCAGAVDLEGMRGVMAKEHEWDACTANGQMAFPPLYHTTHTYDSMAFLDADAAPRSQMRDRLVQRHVRHLAFYNQKVKPDEDNPKHAVTLAKVYSSFNGCTLYQRAALENARYESLPYDDVGCEHVGLHVQMEDQGYTRRYLCPQWHVYMGKQGNSNAWALLG